MMEFSPPIHLTTSGSPSQRCSKNRPSSTPCRQRKYSLLVIPFFMLMDVTYDRSLFAPITHLYMPLFLTLCSIIAYKNHSQNENMSYPLKYPKARNEHGKESTRSLTTRLQNQIVQSKKVPLHHLCQKPSHVRIEYQFLCNEASTSYI